MGLCCGLHPAECFAHCFLWLIMSYLSSFTSGLPVRITCVNFLCLIALVGASSTASNKMQFSLFPIWGKGGGESFTVKLLVVRFYWFLFDKLKKMGGRSFFCFICWLLELWKFVDCVMHFHDDLDNSIVLSLSILYVSLVDFRVVSLWDKPCLVTVHNCF